MKLKHFILFTFFIIFLYLFFISNKSDFINNNVNQKRINFLILGIDTVDNSVHSDTIIFLSYDPQERLLDIISIPRDSYLEYEGLKYKKISEIYAYFYNKTKNKLTSAENLVRLIEEKFFNFQNKKIKINYFFVIDYIGFKNIINTIGKIKILVLEPMHYDDNAGNLHIHFEPGIYFMDADDALKYVRYRDAKGDFGRINRQQQFIKSVLEKFFSPITWFKIPRIFLILNKSFITNINIWEMFNMLLEFRNLKFNNIRYSVLSGKVRGRYLELDNEILFSLCEYLNSKKTKYFEFSGDKKVLLKVYNASSKPKLAKKVSIFLRDKGYDVLDWGNWYNKLPKSRIIDYTYNPKIVEQLSNILNIYEISTSYCLYNKKDNLLDSGCNLIVLLGEDFEFLYNKDISF